MGNSFFIILNKINLSNSLTTKIYIKSPIFISWPYRYTLSLKCTTYSKLSILIMYYTSILHLPDLIQRTIFVPRVPLPWTAIIHENGIRHAISTKNVCQVLLNSLFTFIFTSSDAKRIARMIVNNRQGVTASVLPKRDVYP